MLPYLGRGGGLGDRGGPTSQASRQTEAFALSVPRLGVPFLLLATSSRGLPWLPTQAGQKGPPLLSPRECFVPAASVALLQGAEAPSHAGTSSFSLPCHMGGSPHLLEPGGQEGRRARPVVLGLNPLPRFLPLWPWASDLPSGVSLHICETGVTTVTRTGRV